MPATDAGTAAIQQMTRTMKHTLSRPLPEPLLPLVPLALDLRWAWSHAGDRLWRRLHAELWERTANPWLMLQLLPAIRR
jgi:glycogen phosphorylase